MIIDIIIIVVLLLLGIGLILAEIFLLPGVTVAGIGGGIVLVGAIVYSFLYVGQTAGYTTIVSACVIGLGAFVFLVKSNVMDKIALKTNIDSTVDLSDRKNIQVGSTGMTLSRLNPIGNVEYEDGIISESRSFNGEFIDTETKVKVVKTEGSSIFVEII